MSVVVRFDTIAGLFDEITKKFADEQRPLLMKKLEGQYQGITYKEVRRNVELFALGLASLGLKRGDRASIVSENRPEWVVADMAMVALGIVNVPIYPTLTPKQMEYIFNDAGVKAAIASNAYQVGKIQKIHQNVKSLSHIVLMSDKGGVAPDGVLTFTELYARGKDYEDKVGSSFFESELKKARPSDMLTIIYTSGTTGNPKGVILTHHNMASNINSSSTVLPMGETDVLLSFLPLCHSFERMAGYYTAFACGCTVAYAESVDTVRDNLLEVRPTIVATVPRLFERIHGRILKQVESSPKARQKIFYWALNVGMAHARARRKGSIPAHLALQQKIASKVVFSKLQARTGGRIRFFVSGGAALPEGLGLFFEAVGILIIEGYGLTETSPVLSANRLDDYKFGTVGKPIPGVEIKIAEDGEILARGPNIMVGYYNDEGATKEVINAERWFHTGDIGHFDQEGHLVITDRKKHLFVSSGGKNIAPQPIENLFVQCKYIDQFVLIGDGRQFLSALIVPEFDTLKEYAAGHGLSFVNDAQLVTDKSVRKLFQVEIDKIQKDLPAYERIRRFELLDTPLTIEGGEITPTMKVKRKVVEEKYSHLIWKMYNELA